VEAYPNIAGMKDSSGALDRLFACSQRFLLRKIALYFTVK